MTEKKKIPQLVVVENDLEIQDLICAYFRPRGFQVTLYESAEDALKESLTSGARWDVLLTNFHFANMSGLDFTARLTQTLPHLPIILITPTDSTDIAFQSIKNGVYDSVLKPIHFPSLQISIERALDLVSLKEGMNELQKIVKSVQDPDNNVIGCSPSFLSALDIAHRVAGSSASIFITGESGTGKEIFAQFIHQHSKRKDGPFVAINCSAIPENLLESELFGHAKGSFTGAQEKRIGLFEEAENGTLFLDEIGDLSLPLQAKLLRVLQDKKIKRVGENQYRSINCRIISATHKNMAVELMEKRFREDLFFRLDVIPIAIPPLRDRREDILLLAQSFLKKYSLENGTKIKSFAEDAIHFILENPWRGNVRELENSIERAVILSEHPVITTLDFIPLSMNTSTNIDLNEDVLPTDDFIISCEDSLPTVEQVICRYIRFAVHKKGGARDQTAKELGIDRKTLYKKMRSEDVFHHKNM